MSKLKIIRNGIIDENPVLRQVIGMCPTMAVTTSSQNGFAMGISTMIVLICSNMLVSLVRKIVPEEVRIPVFIVITAAFTTAIEMFIKAYFPAIDKSLGLYIPLITVNCIILSRSESFACKNTIIDSALDGVGMGLGFTIALVLISSFRELLGNGSIFGVDIAFMPKTILMILPPGGFLTLACLMAFVNHVDRRRRKA